jgi:V-type H+-transporting ATPase proteolipid subunit
MTDQSVVITLNLTDYSGIYYDPNQYTFFGFMGITSALVFCNLGSAYGTAKAGVGIASIGVLKSELIYKSLIPVVMAGILGIYGLIIAVILQARVTISPESGVLLNAQGLTSTSTVTSACLGTGIPCCESWTYNAYYGYKHLAAGLCCGLSSLAAGLCLGVAGDAGVRANAQKDIYVGVILILIFGEALGLYGLIVAIILSSKGTVC